MKCTKEGMTLMKHTNHKAAEIQHTYSVLYMYVSKIIKNKIENTSILN